LKFARFIGMMNLPMSSSALLLLLVTVATANRFSATSDIRVERVFGPEIATGRYKHPACITELKNGDLYLAYYGGEGEYAVSTAVFGSRFPRNAKSWAQPEAIARNPFYSMGNPVVWEAPDGIVWLFFVVRPGATWSSSRIAAKISRDGAQTWSEPFVVAWEAGMMARSRPIALADGKYLLPIYHETGADPEFTAADTSSLFLRFDPKTREWTESNRVHSRLGNLQPAVVQLSENHLMAFCRRGGNYEPRNDGFVVRTESQDGGKTWSEGVETTFPNPNAAVELIRLRNGHLLLVFNDSFNDRSPLAAAISTDEGRTFAHRCNIAEGKGDFAYPTAIQTADGTIHVTFTSDERTIIRHATFNEDAILSAKQN
jgi:predicted neuraminidase